LKGCYVKVKIGRTKKPAKIKTDSNPAISVCVCSTQLLPRDGSFLIQIETEETSLTQH